jgi:Mg2+ and Co2+ transporter CorA
MTLNDLLKPFEGSLPATEAVVAADKDDEACPDWYCPRCASWVPGTQVTFEEQHEVCGGPVLPDRPRTEEWRASVTELLTLAATQQATIDEQRERIGEMEKALRDVKRTAADMSKLYASTVETCNDLRSERDELRRAIRNLGNDFDDLGERCGAAESALSEAVKELNDGRSLYRRFYFHECFNEDEITAYESRKSRYAAAHPDPR